MKRISILLVAAGIAFSSFTVVETWKSDKAHSQLGFYVTHLGISDQTGTFKNFDVTIKSEKPDFSDAVIGLTADVASINTGVEMRDKHLKSADFFDAEKYPTLNFLSTSLQPAGANRFKLTGNLTLHGITKPVTMDLLYRGTTVNPMSKAATTGFQVTGTIRRSDFSIGSGFPVAIVGDEVMIKADGEFGK